MKKWLVSGISGCGRIELLNEIKAEADQRGINIRVHDVGGLIRQQAQKVGIRIVDERILDVDPPQLRLLRASAMQALEADILKSENVAHHFVGTHFTFRWKRRLIGGISYTDIVTLKPDSLLNVVNDVAAIHEANKRNPKWKPSTLPNPEETQDWMIEEEFVTEILAEVTNVPMYLVARRHSLQNLADLFFTDKKKIYLSYPITAVKDDNPEMLKRIQGEILVELERLFVVFNPLTIEDMALTYHSSPEDPEDVTKLTKRAIEQIKDRTVERDYQFIDQSDAVVVFYLTEKLSPGVINEIAYAYRNQKPVYIVYAGKVSPFLSEQTPYIYETVESLMEELRKFAAE